MATHAPMARVPFAPLDNPRLQHLASAKNRQNGLSQKPSPLGKSSLTPSKPATKRSFSPSISTFEDYDGENIDPASLSSPSKKTKSEAKPFTFSLTPAKSMPPPPVPSKPSTPARANMSSPRAPLTAPAGRSPKRKTAGISKNRRTSAPFTRIDPPFASRATSSLPFSLDAALSGTFSKTKEEPRSQTKEEPRAKTVEESMPQSWFFEIYEDTPEEEASNLIEHSTLTLDLSSDEECSRAEKDDRGKENVAPEGYDAPSASRPVAETAVAPSSDVEKTEIVRIKKASEEMDDGERTPLSDLETAPFLPEGVSEDAVVIVDAALSAKEEKEDPASVPSGKEAKKGLEERGKMGGVKDEILIWEDSPSSEHIASPDAVVAGKTKEGVEVCVDENAAPVA